MERCPHSLDDFRRHLRKYTEPLDFLSNPSRHEIALQHVIAHFHIVAEYLVERVSFFIKHVVKKLFKVADFWYCLSSNPEEVDMFIDLFG